MCLYIMLGHRSYELPYICSWSEASPISVAAGVWCQFVLITHPRQRERTRTECKDDKERKEVAERTEAKLERGCERHRNQCRVCWPLLLWALTHCCCCC